jgi:hypothetical protein
VTVLWIRPPDCLALPRRNSCHLRILECYVAIYDTLCTPAWDPAQPQNNIGVLSWLMVTGLPEFSPTIHVDVGWSTSQFDASRMWLGIRSTDIRVASANVVLRQHPTMPCLFPERSHGGWANSGAESGNYRQSLISTVSIFWQSRTASHKPRTESVGGGSYHTFQPQRSERPSEKCTLCQSAVSAALQTVCACLDD